MTLRRDYRHHLDGQLADVVGRCLLSLFEISYDIKRVHTAPPFQLAYEASDILASL